MNKYLHNDTSETEVSINTSVNNDSEQVLKKHCHLPECFIKHFSTNFMKIWNWVMDGRGLYTKRFMNILKMA